ncbi:SLC13 family permease [Thioclava atlantica]|uniref:SLC13 family permease n=1 Tax=Thioclava atlantica TaxID=1317124 RepID=UPI00138E0EE7|nr:SLC13 family permease [Thioclava atlantica]
MEILIVLLLFVAAAVLLATELIPLEVTALCLVVVLSATGIITAQEAFQGFASEAIVVLACVMILSRRLADSGAMLGLSARLVGQGKSAPVGVGPRLMAGSAVLSMLFSNTSTTAVMMPVAIGAARKAKHDPARYLMPIAFASIMGGSATLIGTSTNLAVSGAIARAGLEPFGLFEFFWVGVTVSVAGIAAMVLLGRRLVPVRGETKDLEEGGALFLAGLVVAPGSRAEGMTVSELGLADIDVTLLAIDTEDARLEPHPRRKLHEGNHIIIRATAAALASLLDDKRFVVDGIAEATQVQVTAEAILLPGSQWVGMSLARMRRELSPDVAVIGVRRSGYGRVARIGLMRLRAGDILHLVGEEDGIARVDADVDIYLATDAEPVAPGRREGWYTLSALLGAIAIAAAGVLPLSVALTMAVLGLVLAGRFTLRDAFAMVSWRVLILIGGMSSFGLAMLQTGAADWLAQGIFQHIVPLGRPAVLVSLSLLTVLLTQPLSNAAAALTMLPIAIALADTLGVDPRPLAIIVTLSASLSFIAPLEPALLLVYGKGNYRLMDFVRAGVPLTLISMAVVLVLVPWLWPF